MARRGRAKSESLSSLPHTHFICVCVCAGLHHLLLPCCSSSRYTLPRLHIFPVSRHFFSRFWHATKQTKPTTQKNPKEKREKKRQQIYLLQGLFFLAVCMYTLLHSIPIIHPRCAIKNRPFNVRADLVCCYIVNPRTNERRKKKEENERLIIRTSPDPLLPPWIYYFDHGAD